MDGNRSLRPEISAHVLCDPFVVILALPATLCGILTMLVITRTHPDPGFRPAGRSVRVPTRNRRRRARARDSGSRLSWKVTRIADAVSADAVIFNKGGRS